MSTELSRSVRFVKFLREAVAIKTKRLVEVQKYPAVVWFADLPRDLQQVRSPLITPNWPDTDAHWLRVARVLEDPRPGPPAACQRWLSDVDLDTPAPPPVLNTFYSDKDAKGEVIQIPVPEDVQQEWDRYIGEGWTRGHRRRRSRAR